jgi:hypothetical protein
VFDSGTELEYLRRLGRYKVFIYIKGLLVVIAEIDDCTVEITGIESVSVLLRGIWVLTLELLVVYVELISPIEHGSLIRLVFDEFELKFAQPVSLLIVSQSSDILAVR